MKKVKMVKVNRDTLKGLLFLLGYSNDTFCKNPLIRWYFLKLMKDVYKGET